MLTIAIPSRQQTTQIESTILQGDCLEWLQMLPSESFDAVIADPPYGETSLQWDRWPSGWPGELRRVIKPSGSMWVFGSLRMFIKHWPEFAAWKMSHEVIWEKHNGTGLFNDRFRRVHEIVVHFYPVTAKWADVFKEPQHTYDATARTVRKKGRPAHWIGAVGETIYTSEDGGPRLMRSVQYVRSEHGRAEHPTQKPEDLVEPLLRYCCPPSGHVLDPFFGAGTTGLVAERLGRRCTGIELNPDYVALAQERLAKARMARLAGISESPLRDRSRCA